MEVIPVLVLCSLFLSACGVALFVWSTHNRDHEHADRLSLLPLEDDLAPRPGGGGDEPSAQPSDPLEHTP